MSVKSTKTEATVETFSVEYTESSDNKKMGTTKNRSEQDHRMEQQRRLNAAMWRDAAFLVLGGMALNVISYVENHAADADIRGAILGKAFTSRSNTQIVDAGFVLTAPLYKYLAEHRDLNDLLAFLNSLLLVFPSIYVAKVTVWNGDYTAAFRILMTQLFRSFCGWFTYLPPDPEFLMSYYDFPEVVQCLFQDCHAQQQQEQVLPFVSFFSGHVATVVIVANHMYMNQYVKSCLALHFLNVLQIIRLLATRGHYSIDLIIGWCVAVYVSNPAERIGRYYSRGMRIQDMLPHDAKSAFENVTGVRDLRNAERFSIIMAEHDKTSTTTQSKATQESMSFSYEVIQSETTARIMAEMAGEFAARHQDAMREDLHRMGLQVQQLRDMRKQDLMRLLALAELKMGELREEATRMGVAWNEGTSRVDLLSGFVYRTKQALEERLKTATTSEVKEEEK